MNQVVKMETPTGVVATLARSYNMDTGKFVSTIKSTVMPTSKSLGREITNEEVAAFLMVAKEYDLNPLTKEIYAFPSKGGAIVPIVPIDGWMKLINSHPEMDGMSFSDEIDGDGNLISITCTIYRKDRSHPVEATEYLAECKRGTEPWRQWPRRMLRHKAAIQCARYAFSFAGIVEQDEVEREFDPPKRPDLKERSIEANSGATEARTEGFDTSGDIIHHHTNIASEKASPEKEAPEGELNLDEPAPPGSSGGEDGANNTSSPLGHLPGTTRRSVVAFAKAYYGGNSQKERAEIIAEWNNLARQGKDSEEAMDNIITLIGNKDIDGLMELTGLTEEELKEAS